MLDEVDGPMNFTQMVTLFASKMAGGSDDDDVILASFEAFEIDGKIDADAFRHSLMTFGVKFFASEVDDAFAEMKIDEVTTQEPSYHIMFSQPLKLFPISGHDRRCPPEGPDGVQVKCVTNSN